MPRTFFALTCRAYPVKFELIRCPVLKLCLNPSPDMTHDVAHELSRQENRMPGIPVAYVLRTVLSGAIRYGVASVRIADPTVLAQYSTASCCALKCTSTGRSIREMSRLSLPAMSKAGACEHVPEDLNPINSRSRPSDPTFTT